VLAGVRRTTYDWQSNQNIVEDDKMQRTLSVAIGAAILALSIAADVQAGWGRTRVYVAPAAPVVVTNRIVAPPTTTYYAPATTYYAPTTTYYAPAPVVVARPATGIVIPPPPVRIRRYAPSLYVLP
jgi:hypothetical protein